MGKKGLGGIKNLKAFTSCRFQSEKKGLSREKKLKALRLWCTKPKGARG